MRFNPLSRAGYSITPPLGTRILPGSGFENGYVYLFNEGGLPSMSGVSFLNNAAGSYGGFSQGNISAGSSWVNGPGGGGLSLTAAASVQVSPALLPAESLMGFPLNAITILLIRRRQSTSISAQSGLFAKSGSSGSNIINAHAPFTDGIVYWDFGGQSIGTSRLTWSGYTPSLKVERWAFTVGNGMAIWFNGAKVASQSSSVARTASSNALGINIGAALNGDPQEFYFFAALPGQLSDAAIQRWMADPYYFMTPQNTGLSRFVGVAGAPPPPPTTVFPMVCVVM